MNQSSFSIQSDPAQLKSARDQVEHFLRKTGFSGKTLEDLLVVVGEAVTNCIRHAYGNVAGQEIQIKMSDEPDKIVLSIRDFGKKIDLSQLKRPQLPPDKPHGLGIYFMQTIMDSLQYNTAHPTGNEIILTKYKNAQEKEST